MKLNNRGWGLGFLIVIGTLFLLILIFVSFRIRSLTHQLTDDEKNKISEKTTNDSINTGLYKSMEETLAKAGEMYALEHPTLVDTTTDHLIVWLSTLKQESLISSLDDPDGDGECSAYVFIKQDGSVQPFIKCNKYETLNYSLWVD